MCYSSDVYLWSLELGSSFPRFIAAAGYLVHFTVDRPDTVSLLDRVIGWLVCPEGWEQGSSLTPKLLDRVGTFGDLFCPNLTTRELCLHVP